MYALGIFARKLIALLHNKFASMRVILIRIILTQLYSVNIRHYICCILYAVYCMLHTAMHFLISFVVPVYVSNIIICYFTIQALQSELIYIIIYCCNRQEKLIIYSLATCEAMRSFHSHIIGTLLVFTYNLNY